MRVDDLIGLKIIGVKQVFADCFKRGKIIDCYKRGKIIFKILDDNNPNNKIYWVLSHDISTVECLGDIRSTLGFPIKSVGMGYYKDDTHIVDYLTDNKVCVALRLYDVEFDIEVISDSPFYSRYYDMLHNDLITLKRQGEDNFLTLDTLEKHIMITNPSIMERKEQKK